MNHFHNAKVIATMGPAVDKETILSKVVNNIDIFRIDLAYGDDDAKKKYVEMVLKLDSSKSIMLETKGPEIRTRNKDEMELTGNQKIQVTYAEFFQEEEDTLHIDYPNIDRIEVGTIIKIDNGEVKLEVVEKEDDEHLVCRVKHGGTVLINRTVEFEHYVPKLAFLSEKDKKQISRGVDNKINMLSVSYVRTTDDLATIRNYLDEIGAEHVKIVAKIETQDALENIEDIIKGSDGISIDREKLAILVDDDTSAVTKKKKEIIKTCNRHGKPVVITTGLDLSLKKNRKTRSTIKKEIKAGVDSFMLTKETAESEEPIEYVVELYELINESNIDVTTDYSLEDIRIEEENLITDYIIYNAYRVSKEINIKAIVCPTQTGYTPARLSALKPTVPIISFTKNDDAYRYLNVLRGVKGYKISDTFEYENIKQIGKEIIRILFKGNISLDDRILIVHSSVEEKITPQMINGVELYKFKDI